MPQLWHFFATIVSSFARLRRDSSVAGSQSASRSGLAVYRALYTTYYLPWVVDARRDGARSKRRRQRTALLSRQWMPSGWPIHLPKRTRTSSGTTGYVSCTSHVHTCAGGTALLFPRSGLRPPAASTPVQRLCHSHMLPSGLVQDRSGVGVGRVPRYTLQATSDGVPHQRRPVCSSGSACTPAAIGARSQASCCVSGSHTSCGYGNRRCWWCGCG